MTKITMTESTRKAVEELLKIDTTTLSDEAIVEAIRNNNNFAIVFKEGGEIKIKRVLKG